MIQTTGTAPCQGSTAECDPWVPLRISWHDNGRQPLYLMVTGTNGGYVEIKVDPETGALVGLTVIDLPPMVAGPAPETSGSTEEAVVPTLDVTLWPHRDQLATDRRVARAECGLGACPSPGRFTLVFSAEPSSRRTQCGGTTVELSASGELTRVISNI